MVSDPFNKILCLVKTAASCNFQDQRYYGRFHFFFVIAMMMITSGTQREIAHRKKEWIFILMCTGSRLFISLLAWGQLICDLSSLPSFPPFLAGRHPDWHWRMFWGAAKYKAASLSWQYDEWPKHSDLTILCQGPGNGKDKHTIENLWNLSQKGLIDSLKKKFKKHLTRSITAQF